MELGHRNRWMKSGSRQKKRKRGTWGQVKEGKVVTAWRVISWTRNVSCARILVSKVIWEGEVNGRWNKNQMGRLCGSLRVNYVCSGWRKLCGERRMDIEDMSKSKNEHKI